MNPFPKSKSRFPISAPLLLSAVAVATSGCHGVDYGSSGVSGQSQTTCDASFKDFSSAGAAEPSLATDQLPVGIYSHSTSQVYFADGAENTAHYSRIQYLTAPSADGTIPNTSIALRCREVKNSFLAFSSSVTLPTALTRRNNFTFSSDSRTYDLVFSEATVSTLQISGGGSTTGESSMDLSYALQNYWTGGYHFTHRSGETYEFYGIRYESNTRILYAKAVYLRKDLPAGSL